MPTSEETTGSSDRLADRGPLIHDLVVGADIVEVRRLAGVLERYGARFARRVFTIGEIEACDGRPESLAARWAGKEAVAKALGTGIGQVSFREIEVVQDRAGRPSICLRGRAEALASDQGLGCWAISLAHDGGMALAFVVAIRVRAEEPPEPSAPEA
jgi:holo-[acyl-carrier protein] synthase